MKTLLKVKTVVLTAIVCLFLSTTVTARNNDKDLIGTWKVVPPVGLQKHVAHLVYYKVFNKDNTFINFSSNNSGTTFIVTSRGNYSVEMPGIYIEDLNAKFSSIHGVASNVITYTKDKKTLTITFKIKGKIFTETWIRISK